MAPTTLHPLLALLRSGCRKAWIPRHWRSTWTCATRRHWRPRRNTSHKWMIDLKSMSATIADVYMYMCTYIFKKIMATHEHVLQQCTRRQRICCNLVTMSLDSRNSLKRCRCPTFLQVLAAGEWLKSAESVDAVIQEAPTWCGV